MRLSRVLALLLVASCLLPALAGAREPVRFSVGFSKDARLGEDTPLVMRMHVDRTLAPVTEFRLLTPPGLTLAGSRLGAVECHRPAIEIVRVMSPVQHRRCPVDSLLGTGTATAGLLLSEEETLFGAAKIELHAGSSVSDKPGLLVTADTYNPVRIQLTYAGYLYVPPSPFELGMAILISAIPTPPFGAAVGLSNLTLTVGGPSIRYFRQVRGRRVWYHPGGIPLPESCPRGGFRFRVVLRFADATRRSVDAMTACPAPPR